MGTEVKTRRPTLLSLMRKAFNVLRREGAAQMPGSDFNYGHAVGDGLSSAVIMAPALWIARQFPEAPIGVKDPQGEVHLDHPLAQLIHSPNPWYGGGTLKMALGADYSVTGNAYMEIGRGRGRMPVELFYQPSFQITPKGTDTELITHFIHGTSKGQRRIEREDMIHFRLGLDPRNQRVGISPLMILLREIYTDDQAATMTAAILRNLGVPGVIIGPDGDDETIGPTMRDEIKAYFRRMFRGDNAGDVMVLQDAVKISTLDIDLAKINIDKLRQIPEERVTAVMGIPAAVVGFGSGLEQTKVGATMKELREQAYENAIIPMQSVFSEEFDRTLLQEFETRPGFTVVFDNSNVRVLQEDQNRKSDRHMKEFAGGGITRAELRAELGRESTPADEVYRQGFSDIMVPAGHVASEPVEPTVEKTADWIAKAFKGPAEDRERLHRRFISDALRLARVWAGELRRDFEKLGSELVALWLDLVPPAVASRNGDTKALPPDSDRRIVDQLLLDFDASGPDYGAAYLRVLRTTHASIESVMNLGVNLDDPIERAIVAQGGTRKGLIDFTEQARTSMYDVIAQGRADGIGPQQMARLLREKISAGPWSSAEVRAEVIARTETKYAQNVSSMRVYQAAENVTGILIFDAQLGDTDDACMRINGQTLTVDEAAALAPLEHPNCGRSFAPVVGERVEA